MSPDVRDLLSDAAPPPRGADTAAILRRSAQIARRQRIAGGVAAALLVPAIALGATQVADRDRGVAPSDRVSSSPGVSRSASTAPRGSLGTVAVPPKGSVEGANLDDGSRVIVSHAPNGDVIVLDIASPVETHGFRQTLAWCPSNKRLVDATSGAMFDMHGGPASSVSSEFVTAYRTERLDDATVRVLGPNDLYGEATTFGEFEPCTGAPTSLDVDGPASTVRVALAARPGSYVRMTGVVVVTPEGDAGICDQAVARQCQDDRSATSEGAPVAGLPADARGRAVAGVFLARRTGEGFSDLVRSSAVTVDQPAQAVGYVHGMVKSASGEGYVIDVDVADLVTGDAATQYAYQSDGEVPVPNDYVIRNPDRTRTPVGTDGTTLYLLQTGAPGGTPKQVTAEEFRQQVVARGPLLVEIAWDDLAAGTEMPVLRSLSEPFLP
jgi:hypothetical protein